VPGTCVAAPGKRDDVLLPRLAPKETRDSRIGSMKRMIRDAMKVLVLTGLLVGCFGTAFAGTVRLRSGTLDFESVLVGDGPVHLEARGFSFEGFAQSAFLAAADCGFECSPRETVDLSAAVLGSDLPGVVELGSQTHVDVGGPLSADSMSLTVSGEGFAPKLHPNRTTIKKIFPVQLVGQFIHYESIPLAPVVENISARARAIVTWTKYEPDTWSISHLTYNIGPNR
jgi:hypothetical protein